MLPTTIYSNKVVVVVVEEGVGWVSAPAVLPPLAGDAVGCRRGSFATLPYAVPPTSLRLPPIVSYSPGALVAPCLLA
uniref:Uncharacterized protein n=1 Tax=Arundo donax TaxID=35708 RepID=A0A0A9A451_ARUDO